MRIAPQRIPTRQSTDILAIQDPAVAAALRFIRERAARPELDVEGVAHAAALDRRTLERRFRTLLRRSPLDEIRRVRVERAKQLLARQELSVDYIAESCGYGSRKGFGIAFRTQTGMTPPQYRRTLQEADRRGDP